MSRPCQIRPVEDPAAWDAFARQALGYTLFSTHAWLAGAERACGGKARLWGLYDEADRLVAGVAGLEQRRGPFCRFSTPPLTPHTGLLVEQVQAKGPAKLEAATARAAALFARHFSQHYDHAHLVHSPALIDLREFLWAGWQARLRYTYHLDLGDLEALWERTERRLRTVVRKAEKLGYQVYPTQDLDLLRRHYELIYARQQGPPPVHPEIVQRFAGQVLSAGLGRAFQALSPQGRTACVVLFVEEGDTTYAWVAGADPELNDTGATSLLYWKYFELCGRKRFDFAGANIPSIALFKRSFGGDLVPYGATEIFGSRTARIAFFLRGLFGR
jgi:hypothetical protein